MGMTADIYRNPLGDCTNNGISSASRAPRATLCIVNVEGPFEPSDDCPPCYLVAGYGKGTCRIVPHDDGRDAPARGTMMGGNFLHTSDSRFAQACRAICGGQFYGAVAIHDRIEG